MHKKIEKLSVEGMMSSLTKMKVNNRTVHLFFRCIFLFITNLRTQKGITFNSISFVHFSFSSLALFFFNFHKTWNKIQCNKYIEDKATEFSDTKMSLIYIHRLPVRNANSTAKNTRAFKKEDMNLNRAFPSATIRLCTQMNLTLIWVKTFFLENIDSQSVPCVCLVSDWIVAILMGCGGGAIFFLLSVNENFFSLVEQFLFSLKLNSWCKIFVFSLRF